VNATSRYLSAGEIETQAGRKPGSPCARTVGGCRTRCGHCSRESLCTAPDDRVIATARREQRCLVTLDLEFGNPLRYRTADYTGIAILRLPAKPSPAHLENAVRTLIAALDPKIARHLWTIEAGRIRIYQDPDEDPLDGRFEGDPED
jgi:predicted nuclease of predicted toxin-antitoxin system